MNEEDNIFNKLEEVFGCTVHHWSSIPRRRPSWAQWHLRRAEARINDALKAVGKGPITDEMRDTFWQQVRMGQDVYEDAGGYFWRCWKAALGLPFEWPQCTYSGYAAPPESPQ